MRLEGLFVHILGPSEWEGKYIIKGKNSKSREISHKVSGAQRRIKTGIKHLRSFTHQPNLNRLT